MWHVPREAYGTWDVAMWSLTFIYINIYIYIYIYTERYTRTAHIPHIHAAIRRCHMDIPNPGAGIVRSSHTDERPGASSKMKRTSQSCSSGLFRPRTAPNSMAKSSSSVGLRVTTDIVVFTSNQSTAATI